MKTLQRIITSVIVPALLSFSSCSNDPQIEALFQNVIEKKHTTFSYNGEIFHAVAISPANNAWIALHGDKWTEITLHNALFSFENITSNRSDIDPEEIVSNLQIAQQNQ